MNSKEIRRVLTRGEESASVVYFTCLELQLKAAIAAVGLSVLVAMGIRFSIGGGGFAGFMFTVNMFLVSVILFTVIFSLALGYAMSLGDNGAARRDRIGRYKAERLYVEKMMKYVETATEHRSRGGKLMGYMVGDKYLSVERIADLLESYSGVGGFSHSGGFSNEQQ